VIETLGVMLRFGCISASRDILKGACGRPVTWANNRRSGVQHGQINLSPDGDHIDWLALTLAFEELGQAVSSLVKNGSIARAELDIGLPFYDTNMVSSITLPPQLCAAAGQHRIAVTVTYYLTDADDQPT
jgi:hypothetical protein